MKIFSTTGSRFCIDSQLSTVANIIYSNGINDFIIYSQSFSNIINASASTQSSSQDTNYAVYNNNTIQSGYNFSTNLPLNISQPTYISLYPSIAIIDNIGNTSYISNGTGSINIKNNKRIRNATYTSLQTMPSFFAQFNYFISGTLANHMSASMYSLIYGVTPSSESYNIFSYINENNKVYTRNLNLYCNNVDLTCIPASRDGGTTGRGCLVTPDIVITAAHVGAGSIYYFVDNNNTTVSASVSSSMGVGSTDILVVRLSSLVTGSVVPAKILPSNTFQQYTTGSFNISNQALITKNIPIIQFNQFRTARIGILYNFLTYDNFIVPPPTSSLFYPWWSPIIGGDSGNAYIANINNMPVLLGTWHTSPGGPSISYYQSQINSAITSLGSLTQLTTASLLNYTSF